MPVRLVDGEGVWGSEKLSRVDEQVRPEYANWIPLAEANGVFEVDAKKIWSRLYSYNRSNTPVDFIDFVISEFIRVDLLRTWTQDGRLYGFWTGIDKKGRLPSEYHRGKYKNLPPNPPKDLFNQSVSLSSEDHPEMIERSIGDCIPNQTNTKPIQNQNEEIIVSLSDKLRNIIFEKTGLDQKIPDYLAAEFRKRVGAEKDNLNCFRQYLDDNPGIEYPLHKFLDTKVEVSYSKSVVVNGRITREDVKQLASKIHEITDIAVSGRSLEAMGSLLNDYSPEEILNAFRFESSKRDDKNPKFAIRDFFELGGAESAILSIRNYKLKQEELERRIDAMTATPLIRAPQGDSDDEDGVEVDF